MHGIISKIRRLISTLFPVSRLCECLLQTSERDFHNFFIVIMMISIDKFYTFTIEYQNKVL